MVSYVACQVSGIDNRIIRQAPPENALPLAFRPVLPSLLYSMPLAMCVMCWQVSNQGARANGGPTQTYAYEVSLSQRAATSLLWCVLKRFPQNSALYRDVCLARWGIVCLVLAAHTHRSQAATSTSRPISEVMRPTCNSPYYCCMHACILAQPMLASWAALPNR